MQGEAVVVGDHADDAQAHRRASRPDPTLEVLDVMVGTWNVSGPEIPRRVTFEWMEGGFYLVQCADIDHAGRRSRGP